MTPSLRLNYPTALRASPATVPGFRLPKVGWEGVPANLDGNTSSTSWVGRCDGKLGWEHVPHAPSHPSFTGRVPTQVCYSPFPPSRIWDAFPPKFHHGKTMEKPCRKPTKIIKKSMNIHQNSLKIEVRRGPGGSWEGSWAHSGPQGCPRDENCAKRA